MSTVIVENRILHYGGDSRKRILRKMRWAFNSESLDVHRFSLPDQDPSRTFAVNSYPTANVFIEASRTVEVTLQSESNPNKAVSFIVPRFIALPLDNSARAKDFDLASTNTTPAYAWADDEHIWVINSEGINAGKAYVYNLSTGEQDTDRTIDSPEATDIGGIWGDNEHVWILDVDNGELHAYNKEDGLHVAANDIF